MGNNNLFIFLCSAFFIFIFKKKKWDAHAKVSISSVLIKTFLYNSQPLSTPLRWKWLLKLELFFKYDIVIQSKYSIKFRILSAVEKTNVTDVFFFIIIIVVCSFFVVSLYCWVKKNHSGFFFCFMFVVTKCKNYYARLEMIGSKLWVIFESSIAGWRLMMGRLRQRCMR